MSTDTDTTSPQAVLDFSSEGADSDFPNAPVGLTTSDCLTYIEIVLVDEKGQPVTSGKYHLDLTDGTSKEGDIPGDGCIRVDSIPAGQCTFSIFKMIYFGTPNEEIKRSWDWSSSQGEDGGPTLEGGSSSESEPPPESEPQTN